MVEPRLPYIFDMYPRVQQSSLQPHLYPAPNAGDESEKVAAIRAPGRPHILCLPKATSYPGVQTETEICTRNLHAEKIVKYFSKNIIYIYVSKTMPLRNYSSM